MGVRRLGESHGHWGIHKTDTWEASWRRETVCPVLCQAWRVRDLLSLDGSWVHTLIYTGQEGGLGCPGRERFFAYLVFFFFIVVIIFFWCVENELRASCVLSTRSAMSCTLATKESTLIDTDQQKCVTTGSQTRVSSVTNLKVSIEDASIWLSFRLLAHLSDALPSFLS